MKATIKGVEKVNYTSKKTGKPVDGVSFHIERKDPNVVGSCVEQIFVSATALENLGVNLPPEKHKDIVGRIAEFEYNRFGMIASFAVVN